MRSTKKATRFSAKQKSYLDEIFLIFLKKIGEQAGFKADPAQVAQDMRHKKHEDGSRRFTVDEFLAPQQIKSYFSRMAAKLCQGSHDFADEWDSQGPVKLLQSKTRIPPPMRTFLKSVSGYVRNSIN